MSLIQEALRRQSEEHGDSPPDPVPPTVEQRGTPPGAIPPAPPAPERKPLQPLAPAAAEPAPAEEPTPTAAPPPAKKPGDKTVATLVGVLLLVVVLVGGGIFALVFAYNNWKAGQQAKAPKASAEPAAVVTPEPPAPETAPPAEPESPVKPAVTAPSTAETTPAVPAPRTPTIPTPAAPTATPATDTAQPVAEGAPAWPDITLTGIVGRGKSGSVMLNGQVVGVGDSLLDVKVLDIESRSVVLEFNGEKKRVSINKSTLSE